MSAEDSNPYASPQPVDDPQRGEVDPAPVDLDVARRVVRGPAIALIALACAAMLIDLGILSNFIFGEAPQMLRTYRTNEAVPVIVANVLGYGMLVLIHFVVALGGVKLLRLRTYSNAITAAVVALLPCFSPLVVLGIPFGIWALVVLCRSDVRAAFGENER